jgi:hypothetical protein
VGRPTDPSTTAVTLYAFNAAASSDGTLPQLFSAAAGSWPNTDGNANIVPVVANGKVYVASAYKDTSGNTRGQLAIFGVVPSDDHRVPPHHQVRLSPIAWPDAPHVTSGTLLAVSGLTLTLQTRTGKSMTIDASKALNAQRIGALTVGAPFTVLGSTIDETGALLATSIRRAKQSAELWPPDH